MDIREIGYQFAGKATAAACTARGRIMGGAAGSAALTALLPVSAFAANGKKSGGTDFDTAVNSVTDPFSSALSTVGYAIIGVVAAIAFIVFVVCVVKILAGHDRQELHEQIKVAVIVIICCVVAGFSPMIIDSLNNLIGSGGTSIGTVSK